MPAVLTLDKSLSLLEMIFFSDRALGTRSLAKNLGLNVTTTHNIAHTFCARGYLRQDPKSRLFSPGIRLMLLGRHPAYLASLTAAAEATVDRVAKQLNESVLLGSFEQGRILSLKYVPSNQALRVQEPEDLSTLSYCTAFGKVLLAALAPKDLETHLQTLRMRAFTKHTLDTPEKLRAELQKVRRLGYAQTCDEHSEGISAVAVPIRDAWGSLIASLGASAPTIRMQKPGQFAESLRALQEAAAEIENLWNQPAASPKAAPRKPVRA